MSINQLLKKYGLKPVHYRAQNFLCDKKVLQKIVRAANLQSTDNVLEVGPGLGVLTQELVQKAGKVLAVEIDKQLLFCLRAELRGLCKKHDCADYKLLEQNILTTAVSEVEKFFAGKSYKIVANIPYYLTSRFLRKFLEANYAPQEMLLMVQKEVAERIVAKPGKMSLLAVSVQYYSKPEIVSVVSRDSFFPKPKVDSAIIKITRQRDYSDKDKDFFRLAKAGFAAKRKQLKNNLASVYAQTKEEIGAILQKIGLPETARAQDLALDDWRDLLAELVS